MVVCATTRLGELAALCVDADALAPCPSVTPRFAARLILSVIDW